MPRRIATSSHRIPVSNLSPSAFAPFGEVVQNPGTHNGQPALRTIEANQGTATKWLDVTKMEDHYKTYKRSEAKAAMNMFVCRPRKLRAERLFDVGILERHPFTPQTFIPMGLNERDQETAYLVIVAPTLSPQAWQTLDVDLNPPPLERGPPDLANVKAFIARGDQAVTYGPGTWHAPMVVLGEREIEFVVVQYMNGVAEDDVQEVEMVVRDGGDGVVVDVGAGEAELKGASAKL